MKLPAKYFSPAGIILLILLLQIGFFLSSDIRLILDLIPDDAAYYFKIAENFNKGYGFSFDSIHQTNGFQPLWQYILIAVYFITKPEPEIFYRIVLILQIFFVSAAAYILFRSVKSSKGEAAAAAALGILLFLVYLQAVNGMESALIVLMLVILYAFFLKGNFNALSFFAAGILTGLLILSRLDFIFLPEILFLVMIINSGWKKSFLFMTGFLILFLPYVLINFINTGHLQPVSGMLKSSFPEITFNIDMQFTLTGMISIFLALPAGIIYLIRKKISKMLLYHEQLLYALSAAILIHYIFYMLFIKWPVLNYYFIFYGVFLSFIAAELRAPEINIRILKLLLILITLFLLIKTGWRVNKDLDNSWHAKIYDAALWTKENTDPDDVFAMKDAGNFSFLSGRKVINLDGLVNDFYFQDVLKEKRLNEYLKQNNVSYYALYEASSSEDLPDGTYRNYRESFMSYKYMSSSDTLVIPRSKEVYREILGNNAAIIIWKME